MGARVAGTGRLPGHRCETAHLDGATLVRRRAALRDLVRLREILGRDDEVPADDVLGLGERAVGHHPLLAGDDLAAVLQRLAALELPLLPDAADPPQPLLHAGLELCGRAPGFVLHAAPKQVVRHDVLLVEADSSAGCPYNG